VSLSQAVGVSAALAAVGVVIDCLELLVTRRQLEREFDWRVLHTQYVAVLRHSWLRVVLAGVVTGRGLAALLAVRLVAAPVSVALLVSKSPWAGVSCAAVFLVGALVHLRLVYGLDGADQMQSVVWAGLAIYGQAPGSTSAKLAIGFVGAQITLSYAVAGIAKLVSREWRGGKAVPAILATQTYGSPHLAALLGTPVRCRLACWSVIGFEVGFPIFALLGWVPLLIGVGTAITFHVAVALTMGLNGFLWAFVAALPCAIYAFQQIPP
jgi:hypothetical protein